MLELEGVVGVGYTMRLSSRPDGCAVQIYYNDDNGCARAFVFVECMEPCRVCPGRTGGAFVLIMCACIWSCYLRFMQPDVLSKYTKMTIMVVRARWVC